MVVLLVAAAVCFVVAVANVAARVNVLALGLFLWVLAELIPAGVALSG